MACGGCQKRRKAFAKKLKDGKQKAKATKAASVSTIAPVLVAESNSTDKKKKPRKLSKRAIWLRQKRREARRLKKQTKI